VVKILSQTGIRFKTRVFFCHQKDKKSKLKMFNLGEAFVIGTTYTGGIVPGSIKADMVKFGPGPVPEFEFPTYSLTNFSAPKVFLKGEKVEALLEEMDTVRADPEWDDIPFCYLIQGDMFNHIPALPEVKESLLAMKQAALERDCAAYTMAYQDFDEAVIASYLKFLEL
jgi:hypothetical protein